MEGSSRPTGQSMMVKSIAFSSLRACPRKHSKPERSGCRDASTPLARSLAGSQTRAPASGGIFPGIWATCWRTFRTLGRRGIRVSNCRHCGWETKSVESGYMSKTRVLFPPELCRIRESNYFAPQVSRIPGNRSQTLASHVLRILATGDKFLSLT